VRRGRLCDSAETYRNFSGMAAPCKNPGSPLRSTGQCNVRPRPILAVSSALGEALPDQAMPVKARAARARLRRLAALTNIACPGV
jgi:hypothetical protein